MSEIKPGIIANCLRSIADSVEDADSVSKDSSIKIGFDDELVKDISSEYGKNYSLSEGPEYRVDVHIQYKKKTPKLNKQSGFIIEGLAIAVVAIAVGLFSGLMHVEKTSRVEAQHQQQQIDNIKAGGVNDGKADW